MVERIGIVFNYVSAMKEIGDALNFLLCPNHEEVQILLKNMTKFDFQFDEDTRSVQQTNINISLINDLEDTASSVVMKSVPIIVQNLQSMIREIDSFLKSRTNNFALKMAAVEKEKAEFNRTMKKLTEETIAQHKNAVEKPLLSWESEKEKPAGIIADTSNISGSASSSSSSSSSSLPSSPSSSRDEIGLKKEDFQSVTVDTGDLDLSSVFTNFNSDVSSSSSSSSSAPCICPAVLFAANSRRSQILTRWHFTALLGRMGVRWQVQRWTLTYADYDDGRSMSTMLNRNRSNTGGTVIVVRDTNRRVFGGFFSQRLERQSRHYGDGETLVFAFAETGKATEKDREGAEKEVSVEVYPSTRSNHYHVFCNEFIAFGGGLGEAIRIHGDLSRGSSRVCATFGSPPLASAEEFEVGAVEVFALQ